jgi:hypothetical protein
LVRQQWEREGVGNLEAVELGLREALRKDGCKLLEKLLQDFSQSLLEAVSQPGEKHHPDRPKSFDCLFGSVHLKRDYFYRPSENTGRVPLDDALGLVDGSSPGLVRVASRAAARSGYEAGSQDLAAYAGIQIEGRQIQRLVQYSGPLIAQELKKGPCKIEQAIPVMYVEVDGTGVPMVPEELVGRKGKQPDGSAKTREVKLGCVFTQTTTDDEGNPLRDPGSTTYVGSFESSDSFGLKVREEARRRGIGSAQKIIFLGDGAAWVWEVARLNFPTALCILDFYHAMEHLFELCRSLYTNQKWIDRIQNQWVELMEQDGIEEVMAAARRRLKDLSPDLWESVEKKIAYFETNKGRMLYKTYRGNGYFYGSGVVEAGCKTVVGQRLKLSGMLWSRPGAENVLELRCALLGHRWDECWNRVHQNDYLTIVCFRQACVTDFWAPG